VTKHIYSCISLIVSLNVTVETAALFADVFVMFRIRRSPFESIAIEIVHVFNTNAKRVPH
jgi:hypothetical protein